MHWRMKTGWILAGVCALSVFGCAKKVERSVAGREAERGDTVVALKDSTPIVIADRRIYRRVEDHGAQGRDTFWLYTDTIIHINVTGSGLRWYQESVLQDTAKNSVWVVRTRGYDYRRNPIDKVDCLQVRKFEEEALISKWLSNQPSAPNKLPRLRTEEKPERR